MATRLVLLLLLLLCVVLVGATAAGATGPDTRRMVLGLGDLPSGFGVTSAYYADDKRAAKEDSTPLSSFVRWGRITGYEVDFEQGGLLSELITSSASLYRTAHGAHLSIVDSARRTLRKQSQGTTVTPLSTDGRIGREIRFYKLTRTQDKLTVVAYALLWRETNVKAVVQVIGFGLTDPSLAIQLARKQEARIVRALHG